MTYLARAISLVSALWPQLVAGVPAAAAFFYARRHRALTILETVPVPAVTYSSILSSIYIVTVALTGTPPFPLDAKGTASLVFSTATIVAVGTIQALNGTPLGHRARQFFDRHLLRLGQVPLEHPFSPFIIDLQEAERLLARPDVSQARQIFVRATASIRVLASRMGIAGDELAAMVAAHSACDSALACDRINPQQLTDALCRYRGVLIGMAAPNTWDRTTR